MLASALMLTACNPKAIPTVIFPAKPEAPALPPPPAPVVVVPDPVTATVNVFARDIVNPDPDGNASPTQIRVYLVPDSTVFEGASFEQVFEFDGMTFDVKPKLIKTLRPGSLASVEFNVPPEQTIIAIAVAFRDIGRTEWLSQVKIDNSKSVSLNFVLSDFSVTYESADN